MRIQVRFLLSAFRREERGQVAVVLSLAILPMLGLVGAAVDYSRASSVRAQLQDAMDAAVLAGAKDGSSKWQTTALATFDANPPPSYVVAAKPSFSSAGTTYTGSVSATVPTALVKVIGFDSIAVSVTSVANGSPGAADNSCILALDHANSVSHLGMTFDGAPNVNLDKCSLRSNTSMTCNGHGSGTSASIAAGSANGCSNPQSNTAPVPDIYASLASHTTRKCGASKPGFAWSAGTAPSGSAVFQSSVGNYTQYNICGDLTLSGSGFLTGSAPSTDTVIVVENGSLNLANSSAINALRTTIVLTGDNSAPSAVNFPSGDGHVSALSLSPSIDPANPWQGVALYQDPALTNGVDDSWGPGATLNADGLVYLPNANLNMSGSSAGSVSGCSKIVTNTFTVNGGVDLNFSQASCSGFAMKQYVGEVVFLSK